MGGFGVDYGGGDGGGELGAGGAGELGVVEFGVEHEDGVFRADVLQGIIIAVLERAMTMTEGWTADLQFLDSSNEVILCDMGKFLGKIR